ncbi:unnamed protein product [Gadus morhua 'NCC']
MEVLSRVCVKSSPTSGVKKENQSHWSWGDTGEPQTRPDAPRLMCKGTFQKNSAVPSLWARDSELRVSAAAALGSASCQEPRSAKKDGSLEEPVLTLLRSTYQMSTTLTPPLT